MQPASGSDSPLETGGRAPPPYPRLEKHADWNAGFQSDLLKVTIAMGRTTKVAIERTRILAEGSEKATLEIRRIPKRLLRTDLNGEQDHGTARDAVAHLISIGALPGASVEEIVGWAQNVGNPKLAEIVVHTESGQDLVEHTIHSLDEPFKEGAETDDFEDGRFDDPDGDEDWDGRPPFGGCCGDGEANEGFGSEELVARLMREFSSRLERMDASPLWVRTLSWLDDVSGESVGWPRDPACVPLLGRKRSEMREAAADLALCAAIVSDLLDTLLFDAPEDPGEEEEARASAAYSLLSMACTFSNAHPILAAGIALGAGILEGGVPGRGSTAWEHLSEMSGLARVVHALLTAPPKEVDVRLADADGLLVLPAHPTIQEMAERNAILKSSPDAALIRLYAHLLRWAEEQPLFEEDTPCVEWVDLLHAIFGAPNSPEVARAVARLAYIEGPR